MDTPVKKKGIVYLSKIPRYLTVTKLREIMEAYGKVGRIFLQPAKKLKSKTKKPSKHFEEGWVEFERKRYAKQVAMHLNNKQIGGKKSSKFHDFLWNVKYLPRFKWVHLCERLGYERAVQKQRQRIEVTQAKREATNFALNVDRSNNLKKKAKKQKAESSDIMYKQRETESEILASKNKKKKPQSNDFEVPEDRNKFIKNLFS